MITHISKRLHDVNGTWNSTNFKFRINNNKKKKTIGNAYKKI